LAKVSKHPRYFIVLLILFLLNRDFGVRCNDQKDQQFGVVARTNVRYYQSWRLQHPQEKGEAQDLDGRSRRTYQDYPSE